MEHFFELPVNYNGIEQQLKGRLVTFAYEYKYYIQANGRELIFELDDSNNFRVISDKEKDIDVGWIECIVASLEELRS